MAEIHFSFLEGVTIFIIMPDFDKYPHLSRFDDIPIIYASSIVAEENVAKASLDNLKNLIPDWKVDFEKNIDLVFPDWQKMTEMLWIPKPLWRLLVLLRLSS